MITLFVFYHLVTSDYSLHNVHNVSAGASICKPFRVKHLLQFPEFELEVYFLWDGHYTT